jgi:hypothetical protein
MAVRDSMADIITTVRELIGDESGEDELFTNQQIQDALDRRRADVVRQVLAPVTTVAEGGDVHYLTYIASTGHWETDVVVQDGNFKTLTDATTPVAIDTAEYLTGRWTLDVSQTPPIFLTGKTYDVYAAAADMLDRWMGLTKEDYDFLSAGRTFKRSQSFGQLKNLRDTYRAQGWLRTSLMVRTDMYPERW